MWLTSPYPFAVVGSIGIGRIDMAVVREAVVVTTGIVVQEAVAEVTTAVVALVGRS